MKKMKIAEIIAAGLLIFYVHSVISNCVQLQSLRNMLAFYTQHTTLVAWGIIVVELMTALLLFIPQARPGGLLLSALVAALLIITIASTKGVPHDFGGVINELPNNRKMILLGAIVVLSLIGFLLGIRKQYLQQPVSSETIYT